MIKSLNIQNFKSIKHLHLDCKKINIFIGRPNTGKSNLLESIGLFSLPFGHLKDFIRFENVPNLFYDNEISESIKIVADNQQVDIKFIGGVFEGSIKVGDARIFYFRAGYNGDEFDISKHQELPFKFYKFEIVKDFTRPELVSLLPPKGENLLYILQTSKALRKVASDILNEFGLRVMLTPQDRKMEVAKEIEDTIIPYPYWLLSDTLQRVIFHLVAIETNKRAIIIFEEPEAHAFPYYTKILAERIAMDKTNQYFISTHNPYFLLSLIEKSPKDDINVFITYFKDYQTGVRLLTHEEMSEALDLEESIFFNLDKFLGEE